MCLGLGGRLAPRYSYPNIQLTKLSWIDEYGAFSQIRSHILKFISREYILCALVHLNYKKALSDSHLQLLGVKGRNLSEFLVGISLCHCAYAKTLTKTKKKYTRHCCIEPHACAV